MAAFLQINQGKLTSSERKNNYQWNVVNTSLDDEDIIMEQGFLPLIVKKNEGRLSKSDIKIFDDIYKRFFVKGKYLTKNHYENLQKLLVKYGINKIIIPNDGIYWQPITQKSSPTYDSWIENGKARLLRLTQIAMEQCNNGVYILATPESTSSSNMTS